MTVKELKEALSSIDNKHLNDTVIMFDGPAYYTPNKVEIMKDAEWGDKFKNHVLID